MSPATNVVPFRDSCSFDIDCIFGVDIGRDCSGNFAFALNGLAVRTPDDRFVVPYLKKGVARLTDATCLTLSGFDPCIFRFPVTEVYPGDLIVTADSPFSALFVVEVDGDSVRGVVPGTQQLVRYIPPDTVFGPRFFVKVFSLLNLFGGGGGGEGGPSQGSGINPLFFLLCCGSGCGTCGSGGGGGRDGGLMTALLLSQLSGGGGGNLFNAKGGGGATNLIPLLALLGGKGGGGGGGGLDPLLLLALSGGFNPGAGGFANFASQSGGGGGQEQYSKGGQEQPQHQQGPSSEPKKR